MKVIIFGFGLYSGIFKFFCICENCLRVRINLVLRRMCFLFYIEGGILVDFSLDLYYYFEWLNRKVEKVFIIYVYFDYIVGFLEF